MTWMYVYIVIVIIIKIEEKCTFFMSSFFSLMSMVLSTYIFAKIDVTSNEIISYSRETFSTLIGSTNVKQRGIER